MLRRMLEEVGTERAKFYRPHDLRRGHAEDLRLSGHVLVCVSVGCALPLSAVVIQEPHFGKSWPQGSGDPQHS